MINQFQNIDEFLNFLIKNKNDLLIFIVAKGNVGRRLNSKTASMLFDLGIKINLSFEALDNKIYGGYIAIIDKGELKHEMLGPEKSNLKHSYKEFNIVSPFYENGRCASVEVSKNNINFCTSDKYTLNFIVFDKEENLLNSSSCNFNATQPIFFDSTTYYNNKNLKRFVYSYIGLNNFDPAWWNYRLDIFKTFCLPSMEKNISPDLYWIISISRATPLKFKRNFYEIIDKSPLRGNIYINEFSLKERPSGHNYMFDNGDFIKSRIQNDDYFMIYAFDTDDMVCPNFFERIEEELKNPKDEFGHIKSAVPFLPNSKKRFTPDGIIGLEKLPNGIINQKVAFTFRNHYQINLDSRCIEIIDSVYHSFQICGITTLKDLMKVNFRHPDTGKNAYANNYIQYFCDTLDPVNAYITYENSDSNLTANKFFSKKNEFIENDIFEIKKEEINLFLKRYPNSPKTYERLVYGHKLLQDHKALRRQSDKIEDRFNECINMFSEKKNIYKTLIDIFKKNKCWLSTIEEYYNLNVQQDFSFNVIDYKDFFNILKNLLPHMAIIMATRGGTGRYFYKILPYLIELGIHKTIDKDACEKNKYEKYNFACILCPLSDLRDNNRTETHFGLQELRCKNIFSRPMESAWQGVTLEFVSNIKYGFCQIENNPISLNLPGLNIAIWNMESKALVDVCNIDTNDEKCRIKRNLE